MAVRGTDFLVWVVALTGATILSVISGQVYILGCGGHEFTVPPDQSARIRGDCAGAEMTAGRAVPNDPGVDDGGDGRGEGPKEPPPEREPPPKGGDGRNGDNGDGNGGNGDGGEGGNDNGQIGY
jgi:hypothetical protein